MTDTATAAHASTTTVLDELLAELGAISLDNAQLSKDPRKCRHYQHLGPVDDHTRRLMILSDQKVVALDALRAAAHRESEQLVNEGEVEYEAVDDDAKRKLIEDVQGKLNAIIDRVEQESRPHKRRLSIIRGLLQLEVERQYPAVIGKGHIIYNQDCTVGHIDHSHEMDGLGLVAEIIGLGQILGGRDGFGAHAGH